MHKKERNENSTFVRYMSKKWWYQRDTTHCKQEDYYLYDRYRHHYVCFNCRLSSKTGNLSKQNDLYKKDTLCSSCNQPKVKIGLKFRAPPKYNIKAWKNAENIYNNDPYFFTYTERGELWDDDIPGLNVERV
jgi:superfamily II helicase